MPRTKLEDVNQLTDPLYQYNFDLVIANVPGVSGADVRSLRTKIQTTSIPGIETEVVDVALHGVTKRYAGRKTYAGSLEFEMLELRDMSSRNTLRGWHDFTRNHSGQGAYSDEYMTTVDIVLYDDKDAEVKTIRLFNCWLSAFADASVDGSSSEAVTVGGTLTYFYHEDTDLNT